jgi:hypothetical protein
MNIVAYKAGLAIPNNAPAFIARAQNMKFYWNYAFGTALVTVRAGRCDIMVSTYQMCILHAFNELASYSGKLTLGKLLEVWFTSTIG